jgi:hypothetical protein
MEAFYLSLNPGVLERTTEFLRALKHWARSLAPWLLCVGLLLARPRIPVGCACARGSDRAVSAGEAIVGARVPATRSAKWTRSS